MERRQSLEQAYLQGQIDGLKYAISVEKRGFWWHFRDMLARTLQKWADYIKSKQ